jgi:hypothetical protein
MGLLALVFYLFFGINVFAFSGLLALQQFLSILNRLSQVFCLDQYQQARNEKVSYEKVGVELKDASFSWGF